MNTTLATYVKANDKDADFVADCAAEAAELVAEFIGGGTVPEKVKARAILEVGADLYNRRTSRNGVMGLDSTDSAPTRIRNDPMKAAASLLLPYLGPGIA